MKRLAVVTAVLLLFTGCKIRVDLNTEINADESGTISFAIALDEEFRRAFEQLGSGFGAEGGGGAGSPDPFADFEKQVPEGWDSERFTDGEFEGLRISRDFKDFEDLELAIAETEGVTEQPATGSATATPAPTFEEFNVRRDGDIFTFELGATAVDLSEAGVPDDPGEGDPGSGGDDASADFEEAFGELEVQAVITVTMPGKVTDTNAHEEDGSELTWRFDQNSGSQQIRAVSDASQSAGGGGGFPMVAAIVGGGGAAALAAGLVLASRRKKAAPSYAAPGDVPPPGAPAPPPPPP